jgi:hypothetical protein
MVYGGVALWESSDAVGGAANGSFSLSIVVSTNIDAIDRLEIDTELSKGLFETISPRSKLSMHVDPDRGAQQVGWAAGADWPSLHTASSLTSVVDRECDYAKSVE